jgi:hypothetical protein
MQINISIVLAPLIPILHSPLCVVTVLLRSLGFVLILVGSLSLFIIFGCVVEGG